MVAYAKIVAETAATPNATGAKQREFINQVSLHIDANMNVDDTKLRQIVNDFPGGCKDAKDAFLARCGVKDDGPIFKVALWTDSYYSFDTVSGDADGALTKIMRELGLELLDPKGTVAGIHDPIDGNKVRTFKVRIVHLPRFLIALQVNPRIVTRSDGHHVIAGRIPPQGNTSLKPINFYLSEER